MRKTEIKHNKYKPDRFQTLQFELSAGVGRLTISRPKALNVLNALLLEELTAFAENPAKSLQALIIEGAGDKAFSAGADVKEMATLNPREAEAFAKKGQRAFSAVENISCPVMALVRGFALGGGLELALSCDILIFGEKVKVGFPETALGLFPAFGGIQRLTRAVGFFKAKEMIFSGKFYTAGEALQMGLANYVVPEESLPDKALELAQDLKHKGPLALSKAKTLIHQSEDLPLREGLKRSALEFGRIFQTEDAKAGLQAFVEKRKPVFKGR